MFLDTSSLKQLKYLTIKVNHKLIYNLHVLSVAFLVTNLSPI